MKQWISLLLTVLLLVLVGSAQAEGFSVRVEKDIIGFDENQITVETDQTGLLTLTLSDAYGTYRTITREAKRGVTTFMWDGLGENEETFVVLPNVFFSVSSFVFRSSAA